MITKITERKELYVFLLQQIYMQPQITKEMERMNHPAPIEITE